METDFLIGVTVTACTTAQIKTTPTPKVADDSLVTPSSCPSPCWHGLVLGQSTRQDVVEFLENDPLVAGNYDPNHAHTPGMWWWAEEEHSSERANQFIFESDSLIEIALVPNTDLTLTRVLESNGAPDMFILSVRLYAHSNDRGYDLELWYTKLGARIKWVYEDSELPYDNPTIHICPNQDLAAIENLYLTEERIVRVLNNLPCTPQKMDAVFFLATSWPVQLMIPGR